MKNEELKKIIDLYVENGADNPFLYDQMQRILERVSEEEKNEGKEYLKVRLNENLVKENKENNENTSSNIKRNNMTKYIVIIMIILFIFAFCNINKKNNYNNEHIETQHYCEVSGCMQVGTYKIKGITGKDEYYCYQHYKQLEENLKTILGY